MRDESKAAYAIIRYNVRTYESGGVMAVLKGKSGAEIMVSQIEREQRPEDRHEGWRYFIEKTDLKPGMDPQEATNLRQSRLEVRESEAPPFPPAPRPGCSVLCVCPEHRNDGRYCRGSRDTC